MITETRTFTWQLVAWCRECQIWFIEDEIGAKCWMECTIDGPRTLVKRRFWICSVCGCEMAFKDLEEAKNHDCFSAY